MLQELARERCVIFPVHPRTRARLGELANVTLVPPLGYREFLGLVDGARCVVTDSGGVQEETTFLGVPCFTLRPNTERPCTIELGTNQLVADLQTLPALVRAATRRGSPAIEGWDGHAAERIANRLTTTWR
jgi:UDP-N-acetylglucosamine 2-epimerase (non-hydrolysing)